MLQTNFFAFSAFYTIGCLSGVLCVYAVIIVRIPVFIYMLCIYAKTDPE